MKKKQGNHKLYLTFGSFFSVSKDLANVFSKHCKPTLAKTRFEILRSVPVEWETIVYPVKPRGESNPLVIDVRSGT